MVEYHRAQWKGNGDRVGSLHVSPKRQASDRLYNEPILVAALTGHQSVRKIRHLY